MRTPEEREEARSTAREVLGYADRQRVRWRALCHDCSAESDELERRAQAVAWRITHSQAARHRHEVCLFALFQFRGGEGTFGVFS